jgi:MinD superfamily P-loop ATPase
MQMKQLVILSGKGGTGKTSVAAAFAHLASQNGLADQIVLADADVDAANLELVLQPHLLEQEDFRGGQVAVIDQSTCASCGDCEAVCRFDAIHYTDDSYQIDPIACDGCAACVYQCPNESISMHEQVAGRFYCVLIPVTVRFIMPVSTRAGKLRQTGDAGQTTRPPEGFG